FLIQTNMPAPGVAIPADYSELGPLIGFCHPPALSLSLGLALCAGHWVVGWLYPFLTEFTAGAQVLMSSPDPFGSPSCPHNWVGYGGKCYYFSEAGENWNNSQSNCSSFGASLAAIDTPQEMTFLLRCKGKLDHWLGLRREQDQPWKWFNAGAALLTPNWLCFSLFPICSLSARKELQWASLLLVQWGLVR
uniref:C-type lectin domain-containing protein n=1 Tax=Chrysemys picta bellii TaxID=8478 RepID=A0A8C3F7H8_CHRPI